MTAGSSVSKTVTKNIHSAALSQNKTISERFFLNMRGPTARSVFGHRFSIDAAGQVSAFMKALTRSWGVEAAPVELAKYVVTQP